jgi:hypothetical protein
MKTLRMLTVVLVSGCLAAGTLSAEEKKAGEKKPAEKKPAAAQDEAAMMEAWKAYMTPSEGHKKMEPMIGSWTAKTTSWMAPGAPPMESMGEASMKWILGGRYVQQDFKSTFMNQPFEGIGIFAFDNATKQYVSSWIDSMSTGLMLMKGKEDAKGKLVQTGAFDDFMTKKPVKMKSAVTWKDADTMLFEMWSEAEGKMFKSMEIVYSRKK